MKPIARVQAAIDAASGEAGEKHAVVMAAGGLPEVIQGRLDDGRTVRTYVWRKSRLGAIALVTGPDVEAKLHTLCEHTPGQPLGAVYLPARGSRPALSDSCCVPKVNPTARTGKVQTDRGGAPYIEWRPVMPDGSRPRVRLPVENASVTRTQEAEEAIAKDRISVGAGVRRIASKPSTVTVGHSAKPEPLFDAKGNEYRATYRVITTATNGSGPVVPSNNPQTMRPEKGYPLAFQARSLEGSGEAGKIRQIAKGLDPTRLLIRNADPTLGTPVVWAKGKKLFVLGGNGRTIAILSAPAERYAAYLAEGRSRWPYAFPKGQPPKGKRYILVRDVSAVNGKPLTEAQAVILAANSQDATSAAESPIGKALSAVRGLGIKSMGNLPAFSWGGIITSDNVGSFQRENAAFVQSLLDRLDPAQAKLTASTPKLMADLVNAVMVGFLPAEVTRQGFANEKDERALLAAMPILVTLHQGVEQGNVKAGWDLLPRLDAARQFAVMVRNKSVKQAITMVELADQQVQLGEGTKNAVKSLFDELDPLAVAFAILLKRAGASRDPAVIIEETLGDGERADGTARYLTAAEADSPRAVSMFGASSGPDPAATLAGLQNLKLPRRSRKNPGKHWFHVGKRRPGQPFDSRKIGTGEGLVTGGAYAMGRGFYFTDNLEVARQYAEYSKGEAFLTVAHLHGIPEADVHHFRQEGLPWGTFREVVVRDPSSIEVLDTVPVSGSGFSAGEIKAMLREAVLSGASSVDRAELRGQKAALQKRQNPARDPVTGLRRPALVEGDLPGWLRLDAWPHTDTAWWLLTRAVKTGRTVTEPGWGDVHTRPWVPDGSGVFTVTVPEGAVVIEKSVRGGLKRASLNGRKIKSREAGRLVGPRLQRENPDDGSEYTECSKYRGKGIIPGYYHVAGGVCFDCKGAGGSHRTAKQIKAADRRRAKREAQREAEQIRILALNEANDALIEHYRDDPRMGEGYRARYNQYPMVAYETIGILQKWDADPTYAERFPWIVRNLRQNPARAAVGGYTGASLTPGHLSLEETIKASEIAARAPTEGVRLGKGNFGEAWLLDGYVVKLANAENIHGQAQTISDQRGWMQHEAGVANELYEAGYTVVPRTIYVEPDGHPGVVREYGEPVTDPSMEEISELEAALYRVESDGIEGWDVADDLLVMRRPDGSIYIADVGFWRKRKKAREIGWQDKSEVGTLLSGWSHKLNLSNYVSQALAAGPNIFGRSSRVRRDLKDDISEGDPTDPVMAMAVGDLMGAIEVRDKVGLQVPADLRDLAAQGFALSSQDPENLRLIERGLEVDRKTSQTLDARHKSRIPRQGNPAAYASTLPAEPTRFLNALGRGPQGFAEPFPLGLHYLVEHGLAEHTNCVDASKTLYNRDTCTFGLTKTGLSRLRSMKASHEQESARRQTALFNPAWLSLEVVEAAAAAAAEQDVSERARAPGQFVDQYREAGGDRDLIDPAWAKKRDGFVARHMAQVEASNEDLFTPDGEPTRRHLALAVWAYSPDPAALSAWLLGSTQNPAPGYQSRAWRSQDWRSVVVAGGSLDWSEKCGAEGTKYSDGSPALCLPISIIETLNNTKKGRKILKDQANKKKRAEIGVRVPWHSEIKALHAALEKRTTPDLRQGNPNRINGEQIGIADMTRRAASVTEDLWGRNTRDVYAPSTDGIDEMIERGWTELNDLLDEDLTVLKLVFDRRQFSAPKSAQEWARSKGYAVEPFAVTDTHLEITQAAHPHVKGAVEVVEFEPGVRALIAPTVAR